MKPTLPVVAAAVASLALVAGCGSHASAPAPASTPVASSARTPGGQGARRQPGTYGLIAAVTGTTMQVQGANAQTAVSWSDKTTFTRQAAASLADVTPGACVVVRSGQQASASARPTAQPTQVSASSVQIIPATNGACGAEGRTASPAATPTSTRSPRVGNGGYAMGLQGKVSSVSGSTFVVSEDRGGRATDVTVATDQSTVVMKSVAAKASDVKVGECAAAQGKTDDTGAVAATSVALSDAVNGACRNG